MKKIYKVPSILVGEIKLDNILAESIPFDDATVPTSTGTLSKEGFFDSVDFEVEEEF